MSTNLSLAPRPSLGAVAMEELRAVGVAVRREFTLVIAALLGFGGFFAWLSAHSDDRFYFQPDILAPAMLVPLIVPLAVWRSENPERRTYLWSLPVSRKTTHLLKLTAGWMWAMAAVAIYIVWAWGLAVITGGPVWDVQMAARGSFPGYSYSLEWWLLLVPFTAATVTYLFGSLFTLTMNYPLRWAIGLWIVVYLSALLADTAYGMRIQEMIDAGMTEDEIEAAAEENLPLISKLFDDDQPYGLSSVFDPTVGREESIHGITRTVQRGRLDYWLTATALWGGVSIVAAYLASAKFREPEGTP
jgi:hypothetical protein